MSRNIHLSVMLAMLAGIGFSCGGGVIPVVSGTAESIISGSVVKGPVAAAGVTVYRVNEKLERGQVLASATTDADGAFQVKLPPYNGPVLLAVSTGSYNEEAVGVSVKLDGNELTLLLPNFVINQKPTVRITPVSTLAVAFTAYHVGQGKALVDAHAEALQHLHKHFGDVDWVTVAPADLTVPGVTNLAPEAKAGLVLGGLSWLSKQQAEASSVTPGLSLNSATLTSVLVRDASDGTLDGKAGDEVLKQGRVMLGGLTARSELVQGITGFINSPRNASSLRLVDVTAFVAGMGGNNDPYLFCPGQVATEACGSGPVDTEAPVVTWVQPMRDNVGVAGSVQLRVTATDETALKTFRFTEPESLRDVAATIEPDGLHATLSTMLDVSALPDGPVVVRAEATDKGGNPGAQAITVVVSNKGPRISIMTPGEGAMVKDSVQVSATAMAQTGVIAKLELVEPPAGVGMDTIAGADGFLATWDTKQAKEGLTTLTFRATDSFGTSTEASVSVSVDNVPFGVVNATVWAGTPVVGATVKLVAIDDATGQPAMRVGGSVLGQGGPTNADGKVTFTLTGENWSGPVQLQASGPAVSYADPSDIATPVSVPATFTFTSFVSAYRTGDALTAPVSLVTTIADAAVLSYAQGKNPSAPTSRALTVSMGTIDKLFSDHISRPLPWSIRSVVPVSLTTPPTQSLRDSVFASFTDVALNQLARSLSDAGGVTPGGAITGVTLASQLKQDLEGDGLFDGRAGSTPLTTAGSPAYGLDANTTRFKLAIALDAFIRGPANKTGLVRQDLQTSTIFDNIADDVSLLYPTSVPPVRFDAVPPAVMFTVTFTNGGRPNQSPIGPSKLVAGTLAIRAVATDDTAVASISVNAGAVMLTAGMGSNNSTFVGTFDVSMLTGAVTLTANACDTLQNCGPTTLTLALDNTPPTLTPSSPAAGFYSTGITVDATATDTNGVQLVEVQGLQGFVDTNGLPDQLLGTWPFPAGQVEGPLAFTIRACDSLYNCTTTPRSVTVDKTAPTITAVTTPPQYTNGDTVDVSVTANDGAGAGVRRVYAKVGSGAAVAGSLNGSNWVITGLNLGSGANTITVWAEDLALPSNSGETRAVPQSQTFSVLRDVSLPVPVLQFRADRPFYDEDQLTLVVSGGVPVVPAQYNLPSARNLDAQNITIKRAVTRLSEPIGQPTISYAVPVVAGAEAPIVSATWSALLPRCPNGQSTCSIASQTASGSLSAIASRPGMQANNVYYDLPLALPQDGAYTITLRFTDAAGNVGQTTFALTWKIVGPPLHVVRDAAWDAAPDPQAVHMARISDRSFEYLFGRSGRTLLNSQMRMARWLIYNPAPERVSVAFPGVSGGRLTTETWSNITGNLFQNLGGGIFNADGFTLERDYATALPNEPASGRFCSGINRFIFPRECPYPQYMRHVRGSTTKMECFGSYSAGVPVPAPSSSIQAATGAPVFQWAANPAPLGSGNESANAERASINSTFGAVVPAASATSPGVIAVYVAVPVQTHPFPLAQNDLLFAAAGGTYLHYYADFWDQRGSVPFGGNGSCDATTSYQAEGAWYWYLRLQNATTTASINFDVLSSGLLRSTSDLNGTYFVSEATPRVLSSNNIFNRTVTH